MGTLPSTIPTINCITIIDIPAGGGAFWVPLRDPDELIIPVQLERV